MRQTISDQPLWLKLVPAELKGGPDSRGKRVPQPMVTAGQGVPRAQRATAPIGSEGMAKGGSIHTEKFKRLAEKLKSEGKPADSAFAIATHALGYEGSIKKGHRRKKGYAVGGPIDLEYLDPGAYTGDEGNSVLADKPVNTKTFEDHEGEYYVNAPMTNILGGPEAVEQLILDAAKRRIAGAGVNKFNRTLKPIMAQEERDMTRTPVSEVNSSFMSGGGVGGYRKAQPPIDGMAGGGTPALDPTGQKDPLDMRIAAGITPDKGDALAQGKIATDTGDALAQGKIAPDTGDALTKRAAAAGTTEEALTNTEQAQKAFTDTQQATNKAVQPLDTGIGGAGSGAGDLQAGLSTLRAEAGGQNPVVDNLLAQTLQKHGADTAAGKAELQMQLSQSGVTGPAAAAAMESYDRQARLGTRQIETSAAQEKAKEAQTAAGQLVSAGFTEQAAAQAQANWQKSFDVTQKQNAMQQMLAAGDINGYAKAAKDLYGIDVDTTQMKSAQNLQNMHTAYTTLNDINAQAPDGIKLDSPGAMDALKMLYAATGGQGEMSNSWAAQQIQSIRDAADPYHQMMTGVSSDFALSLFGGNQKELDGFTYGSYAPGLTSVRAAMADLNKGGGVTWDKTSGTYSITDPNNASLLKLFPDVAALSGQLVKFDPASFDKTANTYTDPNGNKYDVLASSGGVPTSLMMNGVAYTATMTNGQMKITQTTNASTAPVTDSSGKVWIGGQPANYTDSTGKTTQITGSDGNYKAGNQNVTYDVKTKKWTQTGLNEPSGDKSATGTFYTFNGAALMYPGSTTDGITSLKTDKDSGVGYGTTSSGKYVTVEGGTVKPINLDTFKSNPAFITPPNPTDPAYKEYQKAYAQATANTYDISPQSVKNDINLKIASGAIKDASGKAYSNPNNFKASAPTTGIGLALNGLSIAELDATKTTLDSHNTFTNANGQTFTNADSNVIASGDKQIDAAKLALQTKMYQQYSTMLDSLGLDESVKTKLKTDYATTTLGGYNEQLATSTYTPAMDMSPTEAAAAASAAAFASIPAQHQLPQGFLEERRLG